ncbi:proton extrusion protein PcxA [Waterburya agarophytonicola K14]|uniref:Proton extrusion protein PxcA n=1 Tax=Waterburya agarophytonicola KI4 TaxID=2874699 RepID=A0A964BTI7_9CYAN|nr:proton extrusion protein PcxA [Waterburya agarophytonicola KI4]
MKNTWSNGKTEAILDKLTNYSRNSYQWFVDTPTRALDKAYLAALNIKSLEANYLASQDREQAVNRPAVINYLEADIDKYLAIIKVNLAEFKVSRYFLKYPQDCWSKIILIEEVLTKYRTDLIQATVIPPVNTIAKPNSKFDRYASITEDLSRVKPVTEKTGVLPRSLGRTFSKIKTELKSDSEADIIENFRRERRVTQMAVRCLVLLIVIPLITQQVSKQFFLFPAVEQYREAHDSAIFINLEMKEEAFKELQNFEAELKFDNLIGIANLTVPEIIEEKLKEKATELASEFRHKGSNAISNVFADFLGLIAFILVAITNRQGIAAIKSFLDHIMYGLSDSAKAFLIILFTDVFVGFHSPHGWEVILEGIANHLGLQPNHSAIFLFIATFPVILDTILKYWIFRYLNRISPSAVATLKNMNE